MNIVILDAYVENPGDLSWEPLRALGDLTVYDRTDYSRGSAETIERIGDAGIIVTNKTPITKEVLEACPDIRMIAVLATGYNVVDVAAARERGIPVSNVPSYGTDAVAQYTFGLLLELCHHVSVHAESVRAGEWADCIDFCYWKVNQIELSGKTLGIIGFGRIGQAVAKIAAAFGMHVIAYNHRPIRHGAELAEQVSLEELYRRADVISLHCNLTPDNTGMINAASIAQMKDGVLLINTARGALLREQDVADALCSGKIAALGADVVSTEPIRRDNPLLSAPNCSITPHVAWTSQDARQRILDTTVQNIRGFLAGTPENVVNS